MSLKPFQEILVNQILHHYSIKNIFMGKTMNQNQQIVYTCSECKMKYHDEVTAKKCEDWCKKNKSCNLDIIKYAIKEDEHKNL